MPISEATYARVALEDPKGDRELLCGRLRAKPTMTIEHEDTMRRLSHLVDVQLDEREYAVAMDRPRLRVSGGSFYLPDVCVIPRAFVHQKRREAPGRFEVYDEPMPLVVEVWSPSTGDYDVEEKLGESQRRGDLEIWRIHPYERALTAWRRQPDGTYEQTISHGGVVQPVALPGVTVGLERLFES